MTRYEPIMPTPPDPPDPLDLALIAVDALGESIDSWLDIAWGALIGAVIAFAAGIIWAIHIASPTPFLIGDIGGILLCVLSWAICAHIIRPRIDAANALTEHVRQALESDITSCEHCDH